MRDYLVKEMANPVNKDDPLLGAMLTAVNKTIDKRESGGFPHIQLTDVHPVHHHPNIINYGDSQIKYSCSFATRNTIL